MPHVPPQLPLNRRRRPAKSPGNQSDGVAAFHPGIDLFAFFDRQTPTASLGCDVGRDHADSLTEPPLACLAVVADLLRSLLSHNPITNQPPELRQDLSTCSRRHRPTPLLQRCCDDSLNPSRKLGPVWRQTWQPAERPRPALALAQRDPPDRL